MYFIIVEVFIVFVFHIYLIFCWYQGVIVINEIFPDGAIAKDARLKVGDQILEVGGPKDTVTYDFHSITHSKAIAALRQLPAKVSVCVW